MIRTLALLQFYYKNSHMFEIFKVILFYGIIMSNTYTNRSIHSSIVALLTWAVCRRGRYRTVASDFKQAPNRIKVLHCSCPFQQ